MTTIHYPLKRSITQKTILPLLLVLVSQVAFAQPLAFPGAEGGGKYTVGGRGGRVIFVDNLNDKGEGSLRKAVESKGPRTILFRVSGTIELEKPLYIKNDSITIAGQSAPGDGICLKNYGIRIEANQVILRHIRVRPGDASGEEMDAITGIRQQNIIIDHCSFSWSNDETATFYDNTNFTLQWCIISESLNKSQHHKGEHGFGGIWGGNAASFHHNLLSDHTSRNPRFCGSRYTNDPDKEKSDFRNNVIYNWGNNSTYGGEEGNYNMVNNYYKPGPATSRSSYRRILELTLTFFDEKYNPDPLGPGKFYIKGNMMEGQPDVSRDNWKFGVQGSGVTRTLKNKSRLKRPVKVNGMKTQTAFAACRDVLYEAGASFSRDSVDQRIVEECWTGTEKFGETFRGGRRGIIDSPLAVGGWPLLRQTTPPADSDNDGMPDTWETTHKLNPTDPTDQNRLDLSHHFTNLEVYLNSLPGRKKEADTER